MTTSTIRLAKNDTTLARALTKYAVPVLDERITHKLDTGPRSTKHRLRTIREAYAGLIIQEVVVRAAGSRAKWSIAVLDPFGAEGGLKVAVVRHAHGVTIWTRGRVRVTRHALERALHRSVGEADLRAAAALVRPHLVRLPDYLMSDDMPPHGSEVHVVLPQGALLCVVAEDEIIARTWIDASMYRAAQRDVLRREPEGAVVVVST